MQTIKKIGSSGQISLGKENAGRTVIVEELEKGVWLVRTAKIIPDNEMWLHETPARERIDKAIAWAEHNGPEETDLEVLD
ncbi:MAG: hypothetical protein AB9866_19805 [Syntrophobacteraceae bacterium]